MKIFLLSSLLALSPLISSATPTEVPYSLSGRISLTTNLGVLIPKAIINSKVGSFVNFQRPDGTIYSGRVTSITEEDGCLKIYGEIFNVPNSRFGFIFHNSGTVAGAILEENGGKVFALEFLEEAKGYVFLYSAKHSKVFL